MKKVSFTEMKNGTKEDYLFLDKHEKDFASRTADRILKFMSGLTETLEGYQVSRLEHSLQSATRALKAGENEEMIVAALLHDIGKVKGNIGWLSRIFSDLGLLNNTHVYDYINHEPIGYDLIKIIEPENIELHDYYYQNLILKKHEYLERSDY